MLSPGDLSAWVAEPFRVLLPPSPSLPQPATWTPAIWTPARAATRHQTSSHTASPTSEQWHPSRHSHTIVANVCTDTALAPLSVQNTQTQSEHPSPSISRRASILLAGVTACQQILGISQPAHASMAVTAAPATDLQAPLQGSDVITTAATQPTQVAGARLVKGQFKYIARGAPECLAGSQSTISSQGGVLTEPETQVHNNQRRKVVVSEAPAHCREGGVQVQVKLRLPSRLPASAESTQQRGTPPSTPPGVVAVLTPGFLVDPAAYRSYLNALLAVHVPVVEYSVPQTATAPLDDVCCAEILQQVLDWADEQNELQQFFAVPSPALGQPPQYVLMGHSRGAKISALVAAGGGDPSQAASRGFQGQLATGAAHTSGQGSASAVGQQAIESISMDDSGDGSSSGRDSSRQSRSSRVAGLILIDPADSSYEQVEGPRYPSAPKLMANTHASSTIAPADVPVLIIGAGRNGDCIPRRGNYQAFFNATQAWASPAALVALSEAGHFSFLDTLTPLQQSVCSLGRADGNSLRKAVATLIEQWVGLCALWAGKQCGVAESLAQQGPVENRTTQEAFSKILAASGLAFQVEFRLPE